MQNKENLIRELTGLRLQQPNWGKKKLAKELGVTEWSVRKFWNLTGPGDATHPSTATGDAAGPRQTFVVEGDTATAEMVSNKDIRTVEQLMGYMEVDPAIWECTRLVCNKWEMGYKDRDSEAKSLPLFQIKGFFKRKTAEIALKKSLDSVLLAFKKAVSAAAPVRKAVIYPKQAGFLFELAIADLHFGKLCWGTETMGADWDTDIVEEEHDNAVDELLAKAAGWGIEKFLLPIGNDFFHVDNGANTTTAGTPLDVDTRWQKSFAMGRRMMVRTIEMLRRKAPVDIVMVHGNHDSERLYYLGEALEAWFHETPGVYVNNAPTVRKYYKYGKNLIGFAHGKDEGMERLPMLMATEAKSMFAETSYWEWQLGHLHHKKKVIYYFGDEVQTVRARIIPSLCPPDAWHAMKGFNNRRSAEAYLWERDGGIACEFSHSLF